MIYFISDTHFGHKNIINYCSRPFKSKEGMDEEMISRWNATVKPEDTVYHLGDFALEKEGYIESIFNRLNGHKHLIIGNHDKPSTIKLFESHHHYLELCLDDEEIGDKQTIILFHYPLEVWNKKHYGSWHLHGHCHNGYRDKPPRFNVSVENVEYTPVSYEEIKSVATRYIRIKQLFEPYNIPQFHLK